jgi:chemotaxis protein CheZ
MPLPPAPMPLTDADYEAIEAAVVETNRGRWFLAEYARRNRHADTRMLLSAIERIEAAIRGERAAESVDRIRFDLVEMAKAIARTKAEIAAIKPDVEQAGKFGEATEELDSIVSATEAATSDILAAAEQVQEVAWTLREQGLDPQVCDLLDAKATAVYTACSFQDLTGQRTRKVIQVLRYLEGRINAMIDIWGLDGPMAAEAAETARAREREAALASGPAQPGHGLDQADVDIVMGPAATAAPMQEGDATEVEWVAPAPKPTPANPASDPLAPLNALTPEEKIALFS